MGDGRKTNGDNYSLAKGWLNKSLVYKYIIYVNAAFSGQTPLFGKVLSKVILK